MISVAILSFFLALYNENKFSKKIEEINSLGEEIKEISVRLERLNNYQKGITETNKIIFQLYELMDYEAIIKNCYNSPVNNRSLKNLISNSFNYGQKSPIKPYKRHRKPAAEQYFQPLINPVL
ncbi:MAG: hypothetical protein HFP77_06525 [Methylococcales symbiont of Iophon sp. n. MRB-2018]|nr:MAG: hypothetical protein HFP77_06525 [Methylococcales symbiont of Iophon sp. n. MRB-2018]